MSTSKLMNITRMTMMTVRPHDDRPVAQVDGLVYLVADARPVEHRFGEDRAPDHGPEVEAEESHHRDQGVLETVLPDDLPPSDPSPTPSACSPVP